VVAGRGSDVDAPYQDRLAAGVSEPDPATDLRQALKRVLVDTVFPDGAGAR